MNILIALCVSMVFFYVLYLGFKEGLRLGKQVSDGDMPKKIRSPVAVIKEIKQEHEATKEEKKYQEGLERLMSYTGDIEDEE